MKPLVIFGLGKIADVVIGHILRDQQRKIVAFTCDQAWIPEGTRSHYDRPLLPFETIEEHFPPSEVDMFIAIGYHDLNKMRRRKFEQAKNKGYSLYSYVSPSSHTGPWLKIGENCLILDGVGIQPGTTIGDNVNIWNNSLIGHHTKIENDVWIAAGSTIGGVVTIGERCFIGLNTTICGELEIGPDSFIGAASLISKSTPEKSVHIEASTEKFRLNSDMFLRMTRMPAIGNTQSKEV